MKYAIIIGLSVLSSTGAAFAFAFLHGNSMAIVPPVREDVYFAPRAKLRDPASDTAQTALAPRPLPADVIAAPDRTARVAFATHDEAPEQTLRPPVVAVAAPQSAPVAQRHQPALASPVAPAPLTPAQTASRSSWVTGVFR